MALAFLLHLSRMDREQKLPPQIAAALTIIRVTRFLGQVSSND
jgi:hypothetical protein